MNKEKNILISIKGDGEHSIFNLSNVYYIHNKKISEKENQIRLKGEVADSYFKTDSDKVFDILREMRKMSNQEAVFSKDNIELIFKVKALFHLNRVNKQLNFYFINNDEVQIHFDSEKEAIQELNRLLNNIN